MLTCFTRTHKNIVCLSLFGVMLSGSSLNAQTWDVDRDGNWGAAGNWNPTSVPNGVGETATLGDIITAARTVTLNNNASVGTLNINSSNDYTLTRSSLARTLTFDAASGAATINIQNSGNFSVTGTANLVLQDPLVINHTGTGRFAVESSVSGAGAITHTGTGGTLFAGSVSNAYSGATTVNGGTLELAKTVGAQAIVGSTVTVNSGGTLLLGNNNQIADTTSMTLAGGTLATGSSAGFSETLGALTLSGDSAINLGTAVHLLQFADSSSLSSAWSGTLSIYGWTGLPTASGTSGRIFFGSNTSGLTASQLNMISFNGFGQGAILLNNGELVPVAVPDAPKILAALIIVGVVVMKELKFRRRARPAANKPLAA